VLPSLYDFAIEHFDPVGSVALKQEHTNNDYTLMLAFCTPLSRKNVVFYYTTLDFYLLDAFFFYVLGFLYTSYDFWG
jgi:hypothetical protein